MYQPCIGSRRLVAGQQNVALSITALTCEKQKKKKPFLVECMCTVTSSLLVWIYCPGINGISLAKCLSELIIFSPRSWVSRLLPGCDGCHCWVGLFRVKGFFNFLFFSAAEQGEISEELVTSQQPDGWTFFLQSWGWIVVVPETFHSSPPCSRLVVIIPGKHQYGGTLVRGTLQQSHRSSVEVQVIIYSLTAHLSSSPSLSDLLHLPHRPQ